MFIICFQTFLITVVFFVNYLFIYFIVERAVAKYRHKYTYEKKFTYIYISERKKDRANLIGNLEP